MWEINGKIYIEDFIEEHSIVTSRRMGFRKGYSITDAIAELVVDINKNTNCHDYTAGVFLDLRNAFNCVDHGMLNYHICAWIKDYLSNRTQLVRINGCTSELLEVTCGVPQGSVLRPIFFQIYINDIVNLPLSSRIVLYTDDAVLYVQGPDPQVIIEQLQRYVDLTVHWMEYSRLTINIKKTKYMLFGSPAMMKQISLQTITPIRIKNSIVIHVSTFGYFGITL